MANQANIPVTGIVTQSNVVGNGYLIIFAGQSNGTDRYTISGNISSPYTDVQLSSYSYFKTADNSSDNGSWVQYHAGFNTQAGVTNGTYFGVAASLISKLKTTYNKDSFVLPTAVGGTYIADDVTPSWNILHSGEYYDRMLNYYFRRAYPLITCCHLTPVFVWVHGESDSDTLAHGQAYNANIIALFNKVRIDFGFPNMKIIVTRLRSDYGGPSLGLADVRQAQVDVVNSLSNMYLYDTETPLTPLSSDGQHYNPIVSSYGGVQSATNLGNGLADLISTF